MNDFHPLIAAMKEGRVGEYRGPLRVYASSLYSDGSSSVLMARQGAEKFLLAVGSGGLYRDLQGSDIDGAKVCPLSHANRMVINRFVEFTRPVAAGKTRASMGLGDRLGRATPGHIDAVKERGVFPFLAQQSVRELTLTGRNFDGVLDDAAFGVFQEGYRGGYGADGDHLKRTEDIAQAISLGYTMITLDCSEHIHGTALTMDARDLADALREVPGDIRKRYSSAYLDRTFSVGGFDIVFDEESLMRILLTYHKALDFIRRIFQGHIAPAPGDLDFEISIDETAVPTSPGAHYVIARELKAMKVDITSMAPRFCGEFQKGIDYIGDAAFFEREFMVHAAIAGEFGYRISIHSGSDKFRIFPVIARHGGAFHVKTAGTNWLEAVKLIALRDPRLYRAMHRFALANFHEAKKYYHVTTDTDAIVPLEKMSDGELADYLTDDNARQLLHVTYGLLLQARDEDRNYLFRDRIYSLLEQNEDQYRHLISAHIRKHLDSLGKQDEKIHTR